MKIYISGPITGLPELNKPAFDREESRLRSMGLSVFNPQTIAPPKEKLTGRDLWRHYMRECVKMIPECDRILMLPGWENSDGAKEERRIAKMLGIPVQYADERTAVVFPRAEVL